MKLDSKYFDRIRIKPDQERLCRERLPRCDWPGCDCPARYPAPKGRAQEGEYHHYCLEHVRQYNRSYDYFAGMQDAAISDFQKSAVTGHRPTWSLGVNAWADARRQSAWRPNGFAYAFKTDPLGLFGEDALRGNRPDKFRRPLRNGERKSLHVLNLDESATTADIKAQFKALVKRHHPDRNGGDRGSEDKLREIIDAYNYLRRAGLC